ncbi:unnamed protein product, partial [marine sediment metagenome]
IIPNITEVMHFCHKIKIPIIASKLTILTDHTEAPIGLGNLGKLRPFLQKEGFREGSWGHDLFDTLPKIDFSIRKWSLSPFYQTELDHLLTALDCDTVILCGFTTNGVVETSAREAVGRNVQVVTLTDCVTSYSETLHEASLTNLGAFGQIITSKEWMQNHPEMVNT